MQNCRGVHGAGEEGSGGVTGIERGPDAADQLVVVLDAISDSERIAAVEEARVQIAER